MKNSGLVMDRFLKVLLGIALLFCPREESVGQDATLSDRLPEISPLSENILILRVPSKKADKLTQVSRVSPRDRIGTTGGDPGRVSIDAGCMLTLKGVTATEGEGLSVERVGKSVTVRLHQGRLLVETFTVDIALETSQGRVEGKSVFFLVEVGRESTRIIAIDGELKISNDLGKVDVGGGDTVVVRKGTEPTKGPPADPDKDLAGVAAAEEPFNLIKNPGFELDLKEWSSLRYANKPLVTIDDKIVHGGKKSVCIQLPNIALSRDVVPMDASGESQTAFYTLFDGKTLKPGARYLLRFWVRTEGFAIDGLPVPLTFLARGLVLPEKKGGFSCACSCPPAEKKWRCVRFVLEAEASGTSRYGLNFPDLAPGVFSGTVWLDDFYLVRFADQERMSAASNTMIDLLKMVDLTKDKLGETCQMDGQNLICTNPVGHGWVQLPYLPPDEYDLAVVVEKREAFSPNPGVVISIGNAAILLDFAMGTVSGLSLLDGKLWTKNESTWKGSLFKKGVASTIVCQIRKGQVTVMVDGKTTVNWKGDLAKRLSNEEVFRHPNPNALCVGAQDSSFSFSRIVITPLSGPGEKLR